MTIDAKIVVNSGDDSRAERKEKVSLSMNLNIMWSCLAGAAFLDVLGVFTGLGFDPSFQLEAQPLFFIGIAATIFFLIVRAKLGPLLAGVIFWIPLIFLAVGLAVTREIIPFGGDVVGLAELVVAVVGVIAAHNIYHKLRSSGILFGSYPRREGTKKQV